MGTFQRYACDVAIGFPSAYAPAGMGTTALNAAATWVAYGFVAQGGKTLDSARFFVSAIGGAPVAANFSVELQASTSGLPSGVSLQTKAAGSAPSAGVWLDVTGFTTALTDGNLYWLVVKNLNGTPGTNNFTLQYFTRGGGNPLPSAFGSGDAARWGAPVKVTNNSGVGWAVITQGWSNARLKFSDATYAGVPFSNIFADGTFIVFGAKEVGVVFTTPASWPTINLAGISIQMSSAGTPPGNLRYGLWTGGTPASQGYTAVMPFASLDNEGFIPLFFSAAKAIAPSTIVRITIGTSSGGDGSNFYRGYGITVDNDANSKALTPFGGTKMTSFDGVSTWTDTDTQFMPFELLLDTSSPFTVAGGSSILRSPGMVGGVNG